MKKSIKWLLTKIPRSRGCAAELFSVGFRVSFNRMHQEISYCSDSVSSLRAFVRSKLDDIHDDLDLLARTVFEEVSQFKARLTTIERWLYVITFALIVELFILIVLMFI